MRAGQDRSGKSGDICIRLTIPVGASATDGVSTTVVIQVSEQKAR